MGNDKSSFGSSNRSFGGGRGRGSGSSRPGSRGGGGARRMYDAVCADCGRDCKVPFEPSSGKPVYCSNCFEKHGPSESKPSRGGYSGGRFGGGRGNDRPQTDNYAKQFELINAKLDAIMIMLSEKDDSKTGVDEENVVLE